MSDVMLVSKDELMHYGVKGMKWGHRKNPEIQTARQMYKTANKEYKQAGRAAVKANRRAIGIKGIQNSNSAQKKARAAEMKALDAKAKYNRTKAKNESAAEKAEYRTYKNAMKKSGIRGSAADAQSGNRSTAIYNHVKAQKGKAYADKLEKRVQNEAIATFAVATTVAIGTTFVDAYLRTR